MGPTPSWAGSGALIGLVGILTIASTSHPFAHGLRRM